MQDDERAPQAARFRGFGSLYGEVRPSPPASLGEILSASCGRPPRLVVDLGSGTGLSTRWAATWADEVIGIEPSDDMRAVAEAQPVDGVRYRSGWSSDTGLASGVADVVLAVQALHWMEPEATFREVARLLRPGGVFAALDCDWPPVVGDRVAEQAWVDVSRDLSAYETRVARGAEGEELRGGVGDREREATPYSGIDAHAQRRELPDGVRSWSKGQHLERMEASRRFSWCREIAVDSSDVGTADRFVRLLKSQGGYQALRRHGLEDADLGVDRFEAVVRARLGDAPRPWRFTYRCRLGFAPEPPSAP